MATEENQLNAAAPESNLPRYLSLTMGIFCLSLSIITVSFNGILCTALYKNPLKCFGTPNSFLLLNLAISDFLTGLIVDVLYSAYFLAAFRHREILSLYEAAATASFITVNVSTCTIVLLSIDRFIAVCKPLSYKFLMTRDRVIVCITCSWVYCIGFSIIPHVGVPKWLYYLIDAHLHITAPLVLLTFTFVKIQKTFKNNALNNDFHEMRCKQEKILVQTILMILILAIICLLPYYITVHIDFYCQYWTRCPVSTIYDWFGWLSEPVEFINSCINPVLNAYRLPKYNKSIKVTLGLTKLDEEGKLQAPCPASASQVMIPAPSPTSVKHLSVNTLL
ncbi:trace amine-associated receptor 7e-like [Actinia tenebrosa]|uniref:Trace amine-associated receptor 7e-like n=1 Tax=Actinia tenebrosa TaxID=6105 RepID=A0A6P8I666_ACTTE|nr:trace amine-associated receptor 7e-like [Actinia tenebrosa]